jgi:hypothetical protein
MWEPRRLTTLWAFMACYRDSFYFIFKFLVAQYGYLSIYGFTALVDLSRFFNFLILTQSVGFLGRGISPSQGPYLHIE